MSQEVAVGQLSELPCGARKVVEVAGREIAVLSLGDTIYAVDNVCPHAGAPLVCGKLSELDLTCRFHGWSFDLRSGRSPRAPFIRVRTYPVVVRDGLVKLRID